MLPSAPQPCCCTAALASCARMPPTTASSAPAPHAACWRPDAAASVPKQILASATQPSSCITALT
eukprot:1056183-Prymnesium_polylepis.1